MDYLKDAFKRVREDIDSLREEMDSINENVYYLSQFSIEISNYVKELDSKLEEFISTDRQSRQTDRHIISTDNPSFKPLNDQNLPFSTGNEGVSTDRQTDTPTDRQTHIVPKKNPNSFEKANEILTSLDSIKKEIRIKFKKITDQEMMVFSTIYQLEEEEGYANYKSLSQRLKLSESSVRDHVGSLLKKGIPVDKNKLNNKQITLSVSPNLKKIASLPTILALREL